MLIEAASGGGGKQETVPLGIVLPEDGIHIRQLVAKRGEYQDRLDAFGSESPYHAPDSPVQQERRSLTYRITLLDTLFVEGAVATEAAVAELSQEPGFELAGFEEAVRVVSDYCSTGGQNLVDACLPAPAAQP